LTISAGRCTGSTWTPIVAGSWDSRLLSAGSRRIVAA